MTGPPTRSVLALVPARNEQAAIAQVVKSLYQVADVTEVVVADDGSSDRTAAEALGAGARVLRSDRSHGKGAALEAVLDRLAPADVYVLVDGDVGETAEHAAALLQPVLAGELDVAVAVLPPQEGGGFGLVKRTAAALIRLASGFNAEAPLSGQRALTRQAMEGCRPLAGGFGVETAMTIDAVRLGFRVGEVPVPMAHRPTGRHLDGFVHRARQGVDAVVAAVPRCLRLR
jgi:glycosyltransferase involved in cell wall biosynthesis